MAPNLAIIAIPAYFILSLAPHTYGLSILTGGNASNLENQNPRSEDFHSRAREAIGEAAYQRFERAESAHKNSLENMPLFYAAVVAGLLAEQATKGTIGKTYVSSGVSTGMRTFLAGWFAVRSAYTLAYIGIESKQMSYVRSGLYFAGVALCFQQFYNAAYILGY